MWPPVSRITCTRLAPGMAGVSPGQRDQLRARLEGLRAAGRRLVMITNSNYDYSELLMTHAFGHGWQQLFDLILYRSGSHS